MESETDLTSETNRSMIRSDIVFGEYLGIGKEIGTFGVDIGVYFLASVVIGLN